MDQESKKNCIKFGTILIDIGTEVSLWTLNESVKKLGYKDHISFFNDYFDVIDKNKDVNYKWFNLYKLTKDFKNKNNLEEFDFDISAILFLIKNVILDVSVIDPKKLDNLEIIRKLRNDNWAHLARLNLPKEKYASLIPNLEKSILGLCDIKKFHQYMQRINDIKEDSHLTNESIIIDDLVKETKKLQDFIDNFKSENDKQILEIKTDLESKISILKTQNINIEYTNNKIERNLGDIINLQTNTHNLIQNKLIIEKKIDSIRDIFTHKANDLGEIYYKKIDEFDFSIVVLGKLNQRKSNDLDDVKKDLAKFIANVGSGIIFDLDSKCELDSGLKKLIEEKFDEKNFVIYNASIKELNDEKHEFPFNSGKICIYVFADGNEKRMIDSDLTELEFKSYIMNFMKQYFNKINKKFCISNFFLNEDFENDNLSIKNINYAILNAYKAVKCQNTIEIINLTIENNLSDQETICNFFSNFLDFSKNWREFNCKVINCSDHLDQIISRLINIFENTKKIQDFTIPKSNSTWLLKNKEYHKYEHLFKIYHRDIGFFHVNSVDDIGNNYAKEFLAGNEFDLALAYLRKNYSDSFTYVVRDVLRDNSDFKEEIKRKMEGSGSFFDDDLIHFTIFHEPSSGASTIGKLLLYEFKDQFPCIQVLDLTNLDVLIDGIDYISERSDRLPILLLIDEPIMDPSNNSNEISRLKLKLKEKLMKAILVCTKRVITHKKKHENNAHNLYLGTPSDIEIKEFKKLYEKFYVKKFGIEETTDINSIWLFGLCYLAGDYERIDMIAQHYIAKICAEQPVLEKIIFIICVLYKYSHKLFPLSLVSHFLKIQPMVLRKYIKTRDIQEQLNIEYQKIDLMMKFFHFSDNQETNEESFRPLNNYLSESLIKNILENKINSEETIRLHEYAINIFIELSDQTEAVSEAYYNDLSKVGTHLFIEKAKDISDDKNSNEIPEEIFFSLFISDAIENENKVENLLEKLYHGTNTKTNQLKLRIGALWARYISFNKGDKDQSIKIMKTILNISSSIMSTAINQISGYPNNSDLIATYGNLVRHKMNLEIKNYNVMSDKSGSKKDLIMNLIKEIIDSCSKAYERNPNNPIAYHCEILARQKLLKFFWIFSCNKNRKKYTVEIKNKTCDEIILSSETEIMKKCEILEYLVASKLYNVRNERNIFRVCSEIINFRIELENIEDIKNTNSTINVYNFISTKSKKDWSTFDEVDLNDIIDLCDNRITKGVRISSNYRDYLLAGILLKKEEKYNLDSALLYSTDWLKYLENEKKHDDNNSYLINEINLASYFNAFLNLIKSFQEETKDTSKHFNIAYSFWSKNKNERSFKINKQIWDEIRFYISNNNGLKSIISTSRYKDMKNMKEDLERELKDFEGVLNLNKRDHFNYYYVDLKLDKNTRPIKVNYSKYVSLNEISKNDTTKSMYKFKLLIRPDHIYLVLPRRSN